ncbi:CsbD family protein [Methylophaga pinxianii]|uniref:CsbD family protein n=1 Tax=Methylophaga pinxianii TaxID=2881052 RepID=UPI0032DFF6C0
MMNKDIAEGKWTKFKGQLRENWGKLTDDEIEETKGNAQQLAGLLQERYGLAKDEAEREVEALSK